MPRHVETRRRILWRERQQTHRRISLTTTLAGRRFTGGRFLTHGVFRFRFCRAAANNKQPIVIVNHGKTRADDMASLKIEGDVGENLENLVQRVLTVPVGSR